MTKYKGKYSPFGAMESSDQGMDYRSIYSYAEYNDLSYYDKKPRRKAKCATYTHKQLKENEHSNSTSEKLRKNIVETGIVLMSYLIFTITFPFSLLVSLKFVESFERMVIFRLGRMQASKGPGAVFILPCIDTYTRVDLRSKAFNVPPIQAVTLDGGVLELGATVYYRIADEMAAVVSIQDWNLSTRTLAHTALHRYANKEQLSDIVYDKDQLAVKLHHELNQFTSNWGMEVTRVEISDVKTLKEGTNQAERTIKELMRPEVSGHIWHSISDRMAQLQDQHQPSTSTSGVEVKEIQHQQEPNLIDFGSEPKGAFDPNDLTLDLEKIVWTLSSILNEPLVKQIGCIYQVRCPGLGDFWLDLKTGSGAVGEGDYFPFDLVDVTFEMSQHDLLELCLGRLAPLDAYLSGRVKMQGDTSKAMKLKVFGHYVANYSTKRLT